MTATQFVELAVEGEHGIDSRGYSTTIMHHIPNCPSIVMTGILQAVLGLLKRCENETLDEVMLDMGHLMLDIGDPLARTYNADWNGHRGDLRCPSLWIDLLNSFVGSPEPKFDLHIAENMEPLVRCMCGDTARLFFNDNIHWREAILSFARLTSKLFKMEDIKIHEVLLKYEGLLPSVVQWGLWGEYRLDIMKELKGGDYKHISSLGRGITSQLISTEHISTIAKTPIVSKEYDPNCSVSYVTGLIRVLKFSGEKEEGFRCLRQFIEYSDSVDKGIVTEMINLEPFIRYEYAESLLRISYSMLSKPKTGSVPRLSDTRVAFAIRAGLIEMCLNCIERFGGHDSFGTAMICDNSLPISLYIENILSLVGKVLLHKKSWKAVRHKKSDIEKKQLLFLEGNTSTTNNPKCKKLLDMVSSILDLNGSYCCRCNKSLSKTEVKLCNGCGCMSYCSRACQKEDWLNGHSITCCKSYTDETIGQFQGRYIPQEVPSDQRAADKLKELEINMNMVQLKLFLDNSETILAQAKGLGIPLHDCVVYFDLCQCPPAFEVVDYRVEFDTPEERKGFEETRSKENITCDYYSRGICMQRLFPHAWLRKKA